MKDNLEFDKKIKEELKQKLEVPKIVNKRIEEKFQELENRELNKKRKKNATFGKLVQIAASVTTIAFLAGNGVAYATGQNNIYTWLLEKIGSGMQAQYEEVKQDINQTVESNGVEITLMDIGYDNNFLIMGYKIKAEGLLNKPFSIDYIVTDEEERKEAVEERYDLSCILRLSDQNRTIALATDTGDTEEEVEFIDGNKLVKVNSENEMVIYQMYDISKYELTNNITANLTIRSIIFTLSEAAPEIFIGNWEFTVPNLEKEEKLMNVYETSNAKGTFKVQPEYGWIYKADGKTKEMINTPIVRVDNGIAEIKINHVQTSKIGSIIEVETNLDNGLMVDESMEVPWYAIEIVDEKGNVIAEKQRLTAKEDKQNIFTQVLDQNKTYQVNIYKYYSNQFENLLNLKKVKKFTKVTSFELKINEQ